MPRDMLQFVPMISRTSRRGRCDQQSLLAILKMFEKVYVCVGREKDERITEQTRLIDYLTRKNDLRQNPGD